MKINEKGGYGEFKENTSYKNFMLEEDILKESVKIQDKLVKLRRKLHENPELSLKEYETSKFILKVLKEEGIEVETGFYETAVMATIKGDIEGETVLLRADIDALSVEEKVESSYKSKNKGVMHACGHDAHITWMIGTTIILNKFKNHIKGTVKILFQPAEESTGGARELLEKRDIINESPKVSYAISGHVWPDLDSGKIGIVNGSAMASANFFSITIKGKGGHAATPHKNIDPISIGNLVYISIQNIVSRLKDPINNGVISIGSFKGKGSFNIIPDNVTMEGTIRGENDKMVEELSDKIKSVLEGICSSFGAEYEFNIVRNILAVINDEKLVDIGIDAGEKLLGRENVINLNKGCMTGEDFSYYLKDARGLFVYVGNRNIEKGINAPLHNSFFSVDEDILSKTSAYFSLLTIDILNNKDNLIF